MTLERLLDKLNTFLICCNHNIQHINRVNNVVLYQHMRDIQKQSDGRNKPSCKYWSLISRLHNFSALAPRSSVIFFNMWKVLITSTVDMVVSSVFNILCCLWNGWRDVRTSCLELEITSEYKQLSNHVGYIHQMVWLLLKISWLVCY